MDDKRSKNHTWRITTYAAEPDASWLTEEEAREWRGYLTRSRARALPRQRHLAILKNSA